MRVLYRTLTHGSCGDRQASAGTMLPTTLVPNQINVLLNMKRSEVVGSNAPSRWQRVKRPNRLKAFTTWLYYSKPLVCIASLFENRPSALDSAGMDPSPFLRKAWSATDQHKLTEPQRVDTTLNCGGCRSITFVRFL